MRIAFVSYEYPPDTADGGIGTYNEQAVRMLRAAGHSVEVFAATRGQSGTRQQDGVDVHRVQVAQKIDFAEAVGPVFARRHAAVRFDIIEGPDFNADARFASEAAPEAALVVRLHTPRYLTLALNSFGYETARAAPSSEYRFQDDVEYRHAMSADLLTAPSTAIRDRISADWNLPEESIEVIPNVYSPSDALLNLPVETHTDTITFIGRLERRKGVPQLAEAIPLILDKHPQVRFRFVGRALPSPDPELDMRAYLEKRLADHAESVEFPGPVPLAEIPSVLRDTDICVFPSLWENFPCVCLEAMAAGRGIVGSVHGGMAEMLVAGTGLLADPTDTEQVAAAISYLIEHPEERHEMGRRARTRVVDTYSARHLVARQEAIYRRAMERKRAGG